MEEEGSVEERGMENGTERQPFDAAPLEDDEERKAIYTVLDSFR